MVEVCWHDVWHTSMKYIGGEINYLREFPKVEPRSIRETQSGALFKSSNLTGMPRDDFLFLFT